jgi:hypothetical protein
MLMPACQDHDGALLPLPLFIASMSDTDMTQCATVLTWTGENISRIPEPVEQGVPNHIPILPSHGVAAAMNQVLEEFHTHFDL